MKFSLRGNLIGIKVLHLLFIPVHCGAEGAKYSVGCVCSPKDLLSVAAQPEKEKSDTLPWDEQVKEKPVSHQDKHRKASAGLLSNFLYCYCGKGL